MASNEAPIEAVFDNPFSIEDLQIFDDDTLRRMLENGSFGTTTEQLARSLHNAPRSLITRVERNIPSQQRMLFQKEFEQPILVDEVEAVRKQVLDNLFWELTYWKTPELYEELTEGEQLHPGIFQRLEPELRGKTVLDMGAGSGRATFECLRCGAKLVYAVDPSSGLLHILKQKLASSSATHRVVTSQGRFAAIPLPDKSVNISLSCSAFTAMPEQGGEPGLAELKRVTRTGGKIILIWPRVEDYDWLKEHGFQHVQLPLQQEMSVRFRSLRSALECARRFYAHNKAVLHHLLTKRRPEVPFSVIGVNPPRNYCWLEV